MPDPRTDDRQAWLADVLARYERPLLRFVWRRVGNAETAREIVQDAFVRLCREQPGGVEEHVGAWLYRVCRNRAIDVGRHAARVRLVPEPAVDGGADDKVEDPIEAREDAERAMRALEHLDEHHQEVLVLKFQAGMSYKQIADVTGHSVSNVGFLIHAGIRELRVRLGEHVSRAAGRETA